MGPFPTSHGYVYILVAVDYVSKWIEAEATRTNDHHVICKFVMKNIFTRHGVPRVIISDGGSHFKNFKFGRLLKHYRVNHRIATPYHPQTSGQVEVSNRQIKEILQKTVKTDRKDWSLRLDDALWAIPNCVQNTDWDYSIPVGLRKRVSSASGARQSCIMGNKASQHGLHGCWESVTPPNHDGGIVGGRNES
ncbi:hypothetical protein L1887_38966 [Cichorium endivia]|nr:hypothetical protein L1887_38966 [Cichorium endivia]